MSAAARVRMGENCFVVTSPDGRDTVFRSHENALHYADLVLRTQKQDEAIRKEALGGYRVRYARRGLNACYEVVDRRGVVRAALSTEDLAQRKAEALARQDRLQVRPCMKCKTPFESEGAHHRMCNHCRSVAPNMVAL